MNKLTRRLQVGTLALSAVATLGVTLAPSVYDPPVAHAAQTVRATEAVNIRTGASTEYRILGVLYAGESITATGPSQNGWTPVSYNGREAWICSQYLTSNGSPASVVPGPTSTKVTTDALNARSGPGLDYRVLEVLPPGTSVTVTGAIQNSYAPINLHGRTAWVHTTWLADVGATATPSTPGAPTAPLPTPALPAVTGTMYTTDALNIRSQPSTDNVPLGFVPAGTALDITGVTENGWTQIVYTGAVRWVSTQYLSASQPNFDPNYAGSIGLIGLTPNAQAALNAIRTNIPAAKTIYGIRWDGPGADHTEGRALDFMVYSDADLGWQVANFLMAHASEFHVHYLIWQQHIWLADDPGSGWQWMADRGSVTQNHYDHVHLSVY